MNCGRRTVIDLKNWYSISEDISYRNFGDGRTDFKLDTSSTFGGVPNYFEIPLCTPTRTMLNFKHTHRDTHLHTHTRTDRGNAINPWAFSWWKHKARRKLVSGIAHSI